MQLKYHLFKISFDISLHTSSEGYSEAVEMIKNKTKIEEVSFINNHFKPLKNLMFFNLMIMILICNCKSFLKKIVISTMEFKNRNNIT